MYGSGQGWMMGYGGWGGGFTMLFWLVLLVLGIAAVSWFFRRPSYFPQTGSRSTGLDVLEERYARGEIDRDEYLQKKGDIQNRG